LPDTIAPTDDIAIKLRVKLTPDGRLAAEPLLIEAKASPKGPLLMQAAIGALQSCQPYAMLPADKYKEWKVLDFTFTPRDFSAS
jgi:pyruvate-formate lyase